MNPSDFKYSNTVLNPPKDAEYSDNVSDVIPLPVWTDGEQCVSCWRPSLRERISILLFGKVWLGVLSGRSQPPVYLTGTRKHLEDCENDG